MRLLAGFVNATNRAKLDLTGAGIVTPERSLPEVERAVEAPLMEVKACREYAKEMRNRYRKAVRAQRGRLLGRVHGCHRLSPQVCNRTFSAANRCRDRDRLGSRLVLPMKCAKHS